MPMKRNPLTRILILSQTLALWAIGGPVLWGQATLVSQPVSSSGTEFRAPAKEVNGRLIGQEDILIREVVIADSGHRYRRLDVGVSGTVEGWAVKQDLAMPQFVSAPEFVFPQGGNVGPRFHGTMRYEASKGTAMTLIYPEAGRAWNRNLFVTVHGSGGSFREGTLRPWNELLDPSQPLGDISKIEHLMLDKGYAIAKTRRNASRMGDYPVILDDGDILEGWNLNTHTGFILDLVLLAENLLRERLGERPSRTYWFGHSAGGMTGRLINYKAGENLDINGEPIIDGFLNSDSAGGRYLPVLEEDGKDILFVTEKERQRFVKTIEIPHQLFMRGRNPRPGVPKWLSPVYLVNQRMTAKILQDKGLGDKLRVYEIRGVSHFDQGYFSEQELASEGVGKDGDTVLLDLSGLMDGLIDLLDDWVEKDITPPATKTDWLELGDVDGDGVNENPAIALPEVACPLGLYYPHPPSRGNNGDSWTSFAAFDGQSLEPLDGRGVFVDMNLNRYLDQRENVDQAWQRLGLLKPGERFSRSRYQACVEASVARLQQEKLITKRVATQYLQEASRVDFPGE